MNRGLPRNEELAQKKHKETHNEAVDSLYEKHVRGTKKMTEAQKEFIQMAAWTIYAVAATLSQGIGNSHAASDWADHLLKSFNKKFFPEDTNTE